MIYIINHYGSPGILIELDILIISKPGWLNSYYIRKNGYNSMTNFKITIMSLMIALYTGISSAPSFSSEKENVNPGRIQVIPDEQKRSAGEFLLKYKSSDLTSDDARAIHRKMRDLGIHGGPAEDELLRSNGFDPELLKQLDPPGERKEKPREDSSEKKGGEKYSLEQALSDNAQLHTIAFSGLAFLTGDFGAATFIPPGKVCDFFGFQYMRDIDAQGKGHNPVFLSRVAGNVMHVLTESQKKLFLDLADEQAPQLEALAMKRLPLIKAFYMQRDNRIPAGSSGLSRESVMRYTGDIFAMDAELSLRRAEVMAKVALSLTQDQKEYLSKMKFGDFSTWPALDEREMLKDAGRGRTKLFTVAYMTYASEYFSWTAGSVEADTYFCPERHGTYFGGFYMKDMPAMGKRDYNISTTITGDSGQSFLQDVLNEEQRREIDAIPDLQRKDMAEIVTVRRSISQELRKFLEGKVPDRKKIASLGRRYGELDGEVSWYYTISFSKINRTLTDNQRTELMKLRNLEGYRSAPYYIYSEAADKTPELKDVESFFK